MQQRPVDARLDVKPVRKAAGDKIAEIPVADVVFAQKDEMGILVIDAVLTVKAGARRNVYLAADDRADALGKTRAVKRDRAYITPWSVTASAVCPSSLARRASSLTRQAPSSREYSVCTCRWTKPISVSFVL